MTDASMRGVNPSGVEIPIQVSAAGHVLMDGGAATNVVAVAGKASTTGDTEIDASTAGSDAMSNSSNRLAVTARSNIFNGTTWDRLRSVVGDAMAAIGLQGIVPMNWNGATYDRQPGNTSGQFIQGNIASGVAEAGNPLLTGGAAASSFPTAVSAGQRARLWLGLQGQLPISVYNSSLTDGATASFVPDTAGNIRVMGVHPVLYNGSNSDRQRGNHEVTVLASAARTTATNSADIVNYNAQRVVITIDITAVAGSPSLTFAVKYKDSLSGKYVTILSSVALSSVATTTLTIGPGLPATANISANAALPRLFRIEVAVGTADSVTYSISANFTN